MKQVIDQLKKESKNEQIIGPRKFPIEMNIAKKAEHILVAFLRNLNTIFSFSSPAISLAL